MVCAPEGGTFEDFREAQATSPDRQLSDVHPEPPPPFRRGNPYIVVSVIGSSKQILPGVASCGTLAVVRHLVSSSGSSGPVGDGGDPAPMVLGSILAAAFSKPSKTERMRSRRSGFPKI